MKSLAKSKYNDFPLKANLIKNTGVNDCHLQRCWEVTTLYFALAQSTVV